MLKMLSDFTVDYNKESHLILPFSSLPTGSEVFIDEEGTIFVKSFSYLFAITEQKDANITPFLRDLKLKHIIYPSTKDKGEVRYLMKKEDGIFLPDENINLKELASFYDETEFYDSDKRFLKERKDAKEAFFTIRDQHGAILSAAYTNKGRRTLVNLATKRSDRGKGYASALLKRCANLYLFAESNTLKNFYEKRGFKTVREYLIVERRIDI